MQMLGGLYKPPESTNLKIVFNLLVFVFLTSDK